MCLPSDDVQKVDHRNYGLHLAQRQQTAKTSFPIYCCQLSIETSSLSVSLSLVTSATMMSYRVRTTSHSYSMAVCNVFLFSLFIVHSIHSSNTKRTESADRDTTENSDPNLEQKKTFGQQEKSHLTLTLVSNYTRIDELISPHTCSLLLLGSNEPLSIKN